jgi:hypothetical protein
LPESLCSYSELFTNDKAILLLSLQAVNSIAILMEISSGAKAFNGVARKRKSQKPKSQLKSQLQKPTVAETSHQKPKANCRRNKSPNRKDIRQIEVCFCLLRAIFRPIICL